jgi:hypothetical protein
VRQLGANDGLHSQLAAGLRESHCSTQLVVIGEREGRVAQLRGPCDEQLGQRSAVEQRKG